MIVCRYAAAGRRGYGRIEPGRAGPHVLPVRYDAATRSWVPEAGPHRRLDDVTLLPPAEPSKIVCLALNWGPGDGTRPRATGSAVLIKPATSLSGPGMAVPHPGPGWELRHEVELAAVIGVRCAGVPAERAADVVAGYTVANDITAYAQPCPGAAGPPVWAKHFDGCTPLGPWLATGADPADVLLTCRVDGELRQQGSTRDLTVSVAEAVALVSEHMTLLPGDVVLTGTPPGSGPLPDGSHVEVAAAGIGVLRNTVGSASARGDHLTAGGAVPLLNRKGRHT